MSVKESVQELFREVFEDPDLEIFDDMTAHEVERWDSLEHINLIIATENSFKIKLIKSLLFRTFSKHLKQPVNGEKPSLIIYLVNISREKSGKPSIILLMAKRLML